MSEKTKSTNPMRSLVVEKVTVNIGVGSAGTPLDNAKELLSRLTKKNPIETKARKRNPIFKLRAGLQIGVKVTLRGKDAIEFLKNAFIARKKIIKYTNFDSLGNLSFGVPEYIDFPGIKYDPSIGMLGFDVCVTINRKGKRVKTRRIKNSKLGSSHLVTPDESRKFISENFGVTIEGG